MNYKYRRMKCELHLAQVQASFDLHVPLWVHLGILQEDNVNKRDESLDSFALLSIFIRISEDAKKKEREIWIAAEEAKFNSISDRGATLTNEAELDRWFDLELDDYMTRRRALRQAMQSLRAGAQVLTNPPLPQRKIPEACWWKKLRLFPCRGPTPIIAKKPRRRLPQVPAATAPPFPVDWSSPGLSFAWFSNRRAFA